MDCRKFVQILNVKFTNINENTIYPILIILLKYVNIKNREYFPQILINSGKIPTFEERLRNY